jgi:hypothetical protein
MAIHLPELVGAPDVYGRFPLCARRKWLLLTKDADDADAL